MQYSLQNHVILWHYLLAPWRRDVTCRLFLQGAIEFNIVEIFGTGILYHELVPGSIPTDTRYKMIRTIFSTPLAIYLLLPLFYYSAWIYHPQSFFRKYPYHYFGYSSLSRAGFNEQSPCYVILWRFLARLGSKVLSTIFAFVRVKLILRFKRLQMCIFIFDPSLNNAIKRLSLE